MITLKQRLAIISICVMSTCAMAQTTEGVSIKTTLSPPHPSAMLDVESSSKGILIPRVYLQSIHLATPVSTPTTGLLVYNLTASTVNLPDGEGFYFWDATHKWEKLAGVSGSSGYWSPTATGNNIYHGSIPTSSSDGSTLVGIESLPSGCQSEFYVNGASTFFATDPGVPSSSVSPTAGIQIGAPWSSIDGGHWNEINTPEFYLDMQFNTGQDVHMGAVKGTNLMVFSGTNSPGNIYADGNVYAHTVLLTSDSSTKKNIVVCSNVLSKINNCNSYQYNFKNEDNNTEKHIGVLAQELEVQFPELVSDRIDIIPVGGSKFNPSRPAVKKVTKNVDYAGLTAILLQALKEQQAQIDALKTKITALENR